MKRILAMLGISLLIAGALLPQKLEARGATSGSAQGLDQELIRDTQRQLKALGYDPGAVDGHFGPQTEAALRAYQQTYRLPVTGRLDEVTLRSILPERFEASRPSADPSSREVLRQAQRQLKALGFDPGSLDGDFGPQTEAAIRAYQQKYRLPTTGRLDEVTLRSLLPERAQTPASPASAFAPVSLSNRELVHRVQIELRALGYNPGAVDGEFGAQTEAAVRAYQRANRLRETGTLDEVTLRSLLPEMRQGALR